MFNLFALLPHFMILGDDITKCLDGDVTPEEWNKTVDDFYNMCQDIPEVKGVLAIIEIIGTVTKFVFPIVDGLFTGDTDNKPKMKALKASVEATVSDKDRLRAERSMKFFADVTAKIAASEGLKNNSPETDTSWTAEFFEEYK